MLDNLEIVIGIRTLVERAANELNVPSEQLLTHMVLDCLGDRENIPEPLQDTDHVTGVSPTNAKHISLQERR